MENAKVPVPWNKTPLIFSDGLSEKLGCDVYLKLEHLHPSYSFKQRTEGLLAREVVKTHGPSAHLVIASGGNAALSVAHAAYQLHVKSTVFVPKPSAKKSMVDALKRFGATPVAVGNTYEEALKFAEEFVAKTPNAVMMSPYNHPTLWEGSATIMDEIAEQLPEEASPPDAIICNVGGGSLCAGLLIGCDKYKWDKTRIVAIETVGCDTMYHSVLATDTPNHIVPAPVQIIDVTEHGVKMAALVPTSKASSLGATSSAPAIIKRIVDRRAVDRSLVTVVTIPDELAMVGCVGFTDEHKTLVELACGATLAPAYFPELYSRIFKDQKHAEKRQTVIFIVCGGFKISLEEMVSYQTHLKSSSGQKMDVRIDEEQVTLELE